MAGTAAPTDAHRVRPRSGRAARDLRERRRRLHPRHGHGGRRRQRLRRRQARSGPGHHRTDPRPPPRRRPRTAHHRDLPHERLQAEIKVWDALSALPAVRSHRVYILNDSRTVVPGPRVAEGMELIARVLHPDAR